MSANVIVPTGLTVAEVVNRVSQHKSFSVASFWRVKLELGLAPIGARQRPALYPADTAERILGHFGITVILPKPDSFPPPASPRSKRLVSLRALDRTRKQARKVRAK